MSDSSGLYLERLARHANVYKNALGELHITVPERLPHLLSDGVQTHICKGEERLQNLANKYYKGLLEAPIDAVDVIAQFQEEPILDTSVPLEPNRVLLIPPASYVQEIAYGDSLTEYPELA
jgi:hypothetical protein